MSSWRARRLSLRAIVGIAIVASLSGCAASRAGVGANPPTSTLATAAPDGGILYGYRCKGCHEPATPGAPDRAKLATLGEKEIVDALKKGRMKALSAGMSKDEMRSIAAFLSQVK